MLPSQAVERVARAGGSLRNSAARISAPPGAASPSASGANVAPAASAQAPARRAASTRRGREARRPARPRELELACRRVAGRRGELAGDEVRGDDRAGRGADEVLAAAQVEAGGVLDAREHAHHPRLAEHAAAAEDEHVGSESASSRG